MRWAATPTAWRCPTIGFLSAHGGEVTFSYRDRKNENRKKTMTLDAHEFIRRFLLHVILIASTVRDNKLCLRRDEKAARQRVLEYFWSYPCSVTLFSASCTTLLRRPIPMWWATRKACR